MNATPTATETATATHTATATVAPTVVTSVGFTFSAVGDLGASENTTATLKAMGAAGTDFMLVVGDLSYGDLDPVSAWCEYVSRLTGGQPVQLLVGNHEDQHSRHIDQFAECLPDRLNSTGFYAHRYYFDYPADAPTARFVLIDPDVERSLRGEPTGIDMQYCSLYGDPNAENCDWTKAAIRDAKAAGLWVIVGSHKNCTTMGTKGCEIGTGLQDMLLGEGVDLIVQGHEHLYERSKPLALDDGCTGIVPNEFNVGCIAEPGETGTTIVISGAGGKSLRNIELWHPDRGYFANYMAANTDDAGYGFSRFAVDDCTISGEFIAAVGGHEDSFVIDRCGGGE